MLKIEAFRRQAKQLVRWHGERNYSVGEKLRLLPRYRHLTDAAVLDMPLPLALAQEIVAVEAGFADWPALEAGAEDLPPVPSPAHAPLRLKSVVPILFVTDVPAAAAFYSEKLGFAVDFLHGKPPFYGAVSRDGVCLHLRLVCSLNVADLARREPSLILASIEVTDVEALFDECKARGAEFVQKLTQQAWGGTDFHVRDPDGNVISFAQYQVPTPEGAGHG